MSEIYKTALNCLNDKDKKTKYDGKYDCSGFVVFCYNQNQKTNVPILVLKIGIKALIQMVLLETLLAGMVM